MSKWARKRNVALTVICMLSVFVCFTSSFPTEAETEGNLKDEDFSFPFSALDSLLPPSSFVEVRGSRSPRQLRVIASALRGSGCLPKFFCGRNFEKKGSASTTLNELAYLIKFALADADFVQGKGDLEEKLETRGLSSQYSLQVGSKVFKSPKANSNRVTHPPSPRVTPPDPPHALSRGKFQGRLAPEISQRMNANVDGREKGNKGGGVLSTLLSPFRRLYFRYGRSVDEEEQDEGEEEEEEGRSRKAAGTDGFWKTAEFKRELKLAARIGQAASEMKGADSEELCAATFNRCPYTITEMENMGSGVGKLKKAGKGGGKDSPEQDLGLKGNDLEGTVPENDSDSDESHSSQVEMDEEFKEIRISLGESDDNDEEEEDDLNSESGESKEEKESQKKGKKKEKSKKKFLEINVKDTLPIVTRKGVKEVPRKRVRLTAGESSGGGGNTAVVKFPPEEEKVTVKSTAAPSTTTTTAASSTTTAAPSTTTAATSDQGRGNPSTEPPPVVVTTAKFTVVDRRNGAADDDTLAASPAPNPAQDPALAAGEIVNPLANRFSQQVMQLFLPLLPQGEGTGTGTTTPPSTTLPSTTPSTAPPTTERFADEGSPESLSGAGLLNDFNAVNQFFNPLFPVKLQVETLSPLKSLSGATLTASTMGSSPTTTTTTTSTTTTEMPTTTTQPTTTSTTTIPTTSSTATTTTLATPLQEEVEPSSSSEEILSLLLPKNRNKVNKATSKEPLNNFFEHLAEEMRDKFATSKEVLDQVKKTNKATTTTTTTTQPTTTTTLVIQPVTEKKTMETELLDFIRKVTEEWKVQRQATTEAIKETTTTAKPVKVVPGRNRKRPEVKVREKVTRKTTERPKLTTGSISTFTTERENSTTPIPPQQYNRWYGHNNGYNNGFHGHGNWPGYGYNPQQFPPQQQYGHGHHHHSHFGGYNPWGMGGFNYPYFGKGDLPEGRKANKTLPLEIEGLQQDPPKEPLETWQSEKWVPSLPLQFQRGPVTHGGPVFTYGFNSSDSSFTPNASDFLRDEENGPFNFGGFPPPFFNFGQENNPLKDPEPPQGPLQGNRRKPSSPSRKSGQTSPSRTKENVERPALNDSMRPQSSPGDEVGPINENKPHPPDPDFLQEMTQKYGNHYGNGPLPVPLSPSENKPFPSDFLPEMQPMYGNHYGHPGKIKIPEYNHNPFPHPQMFRRPFPEMSRPFPPEAEITSAVPEVNPPKPIRRRPTKTPENSNRKPGYLSKISANLDDDITPVSVKPGRRRPQKKPTTTTVSTPTENVTAVTEPQTAGRGFETAESDHVKMMESLIKSLLQSKGTKVEKSPPEELKGGTGRKEKRHLPPTTSAPKAPTRIIPAKRKIEKKNSVILINNHFFHPFQMFSGRGNSQKKNEKIRKNRQ